MKTVPVAKEEVGTENNADPPAVAEYKRSVVIPLVKVPPRRGFNLVFADELTAGSVNSIRVLIPIQNRRWYRR